MIKRFIFEKTVSKSVRLPESDIKFINELPGDDNFSEKIRKLLEIGMMFTDQPIPKVGDLVLYRCRILSLQVVKTIPKPHYH